MRPRRSSTSAQCTRAALPRRGRLPVPRMGGGASAGYPPRKRSSSPSRLRVSSVGLPRLSPDAARRDLRDRHVGLARAHVAVQAAFVLPAMMASHLLALIALSGRLAFETACSAAEDLTPIPGSFDLLPGAVEFEFQTARFATLCLLVRSDRQYAAPHLANTSDRSRAASGNDLRTRSCDSAVGVQKNDPDLQRWRGIRALDLAILRPRRRA